MTDWSAADLDDRRLSLKVALVGTIASLPFAIPAALLLARGRFWGRSLLDVLVHLPLVLPPVVTGYFLLLLVRPPRRDRRVARSGVWLHVRVPLDGRGARRRGDGLSAHRPRDSSRGRRRRSAPRGGGRDARRESDGGRWRRSRCRWRCRASCRAWSLAFAKALGEFGATITFVSNIPGETQTLALAIYSLTQTPGGDAHAMRLVWLSVGVSVAALLASELLARRIARTTMTSLKARSVTGSSGSRSTCGSISTAGSPRCSVRRAPARRRCSTSSPACAPRLRRASRSMARRSPNGAWHLGAAASAADRVRVPGLAALPASHRAAEPGVRPLVRARRATRHRHGRGRRAARARARCSTGIRRKLSGGEQQRVALGRALLAQPRLLLLDEPLGSLDVARRQEILPYLDRLIAELRLPMIYVTHDWAEIDGRAPAGRPHGSRHVADRTIERLSSTGVDHAGVPETVVRVCL